MTQASIDKVNATKPLMLAGMPIWRAAIAVGWASPSLQIAFKKLEGVTPGEWLLSLPEHMTRKVFRRTREHASIYGRIRHSRQRQATRMPMCSSCGTDFEVRPSRCPKCGSHSFELGAPKMVAA